MMSKGFDKRTCDVTLFAKLARSNVYWLAMIVGALALEGVALYYQYALDEYPCVLCIHVRIWVAALVVAGALGLWLKRSRGGLVAANVASLVVAIGFAERSWRTLAVERHWIEELSCTMDAGLPPWFALDHWFPAVFGVQAACGFTPLVAFNVTMAEALMAISAVAAVVTALVTAATLSKK
jgi:disulfide bond formation protein DsbB